MTELPIIVAGGNLPLNFEPTAAGYAMAFFDRLRISIDDTKVLMGSASADVPTYNAGPRFFGGSWYSWDDATAQYVPNFIHPDITISASPAAPRGLRLPDNSGIAAMMIDVLVPRETILLTGATPTADWGMSNSFVGTLASDTTVSFVNTSDAQRVFITFINTGTSYKVKWANNVRWPNNLAPVQAIASGVNSASTIYVFRRSDISGTTVYYGESDSSSTPIPVVTTGGTDSVSTDYGGFGGRFNFPVQQQ